MKKYIFAVLAIYSLNAETVHATSACDSETNGATVCIDSADGCVVLDSSGYAQTIYPPEAVSQTVMTPSGNFKSTCGGTLPSGAPLPTKGAMVITAEDEGLPTYGAKCSTPAGLTDDWQNVVTKSGNITLTCHYHANSQP